MCSADDHQLRLIDLQHDRDLLQRRLDINLQTVRTWTRLPSERTDWALETLLGEITSDALALRQIHADLEVPF